MHNHFQVIAAAQNIFADQTCCIRFFDGPFNLASGQGQFATDIDEGNRNTAGVAGDDNALDQLMRILLHQHAIFECAWLALV